jgi:hypothetical protein
VSSPFTRFSESVWWWIRTHRRLYVLTLVAIFALDLAALYSLLGKTTIVASGDAVDEFRAKRKSAASSPGHATGAPAAPASPAPEDSGASGAPAAPPSGEPAPGAPQCEWACMTTIAAPEEGVYEYFQCGRTSGQCTGAASEPEGRETFSNQLSRPFPRRGQRILTVTGERSWSNLHLYAEEHREEFDLSIDETGSYNHRYKVDIKFGPVAGGSDIRMNPPFRIGALPFAEGASWSGEWTDSNRDADGAYSCATVAREELVIGGEPVRTWVGLCELELKGPRNTGKVIVKFWLSPERRLTVQETYDQNLDTPQGKYKGQWMVTLSNLNPQK